MNEGFFTLPKDKQDTIINAGFRIFSEYPYKKAPVGDIAKTAGISKSLLFYHFKNKKELYFFLWDKAIEITTENTAKYNVWNTTDYFEMLELTLKGKCDVMRRFPFVMEFATRAYYEIDSEVYDDIHQSFDKQSKNSEMKIFENIDMSNMRQDIDFSLMYKEMLWATDGCLREAMKDGHLDVGKIEKDYKKLISFWRKLYQLK